ncbi:MAG: AAA family ATPase [Chloroflexi bacterium]|nr:AAA family ATPase [Chloroflexota bacterium]
MQKLTAQQVRKVYSSSQKEVQGTANVKPLDGIIGQQRALEALQFGLGMLDSGYNMYVSGPLGTGKTTAVKAFLEAEAAKKSPPSDWCYVHNFQDPYRPKALRLPCGLGRELQKDFKHLVEQAQRAILTIFESDAYRHKRESIAEEANRHKETILERLNQVALQHGFAIQGTPMGIFLVALIGGKPATEEQMEALNARERDALERRKVVLEEQVKQALREFRRLDKQAQETMEKLKREASLYALGHLVEELKEKYQGLAEVVKHLEDTQADMLENVEQFQPQAQAANVPVPVPPWLAEQGLRKYQANLLVDNSGCKGAPVVLEFNPTYNNLFGRIEKESIYGALHTDFTMVRPGALHRANGGYLVVRAEDLFRAPFSWEGLKRCLRESKIEIEEVGERMGFPTTKSLIPEPVPLSVKVVIIGTPLIYSLLQQVEPEFNELFRVRADFDSQMAATAEQIKDYVAFLSLIREKHNLRHLDASGVAKVLEHSSRLAERQDKLSTRFAVITNMVREADHWAEQAGSDVIRGQDVRKAIEHKEYRSNLIQERITELITQDVLHVQTDGAVVGQVNGLAVIDMGDFSFGRPNRITASVTPGRDGVIDIEREAELGGPIHTKGVLILSGYLSDRFAHSVPLSLSARLVFEQSYEGVEGDSASSTELYALLSRLADMPVKQSLAVTGSVDQKGRVQAIGGVNQKIEGFFDVCRVKGLSGDQGVLIPASNAAHLMLREDLVDAVTNGKFHIYAVSTIDEGMELLTGMKMGQPRDDGSYEEGTIGFLVQKQLQDLAKGLREYGEGAAGAPSRDEKSGARRPRGKRQSE